MRYPPVSVLPPQNGMLADHDPSAKACHTRNERNNRGERPHRDQQDIRLPSSQVASEWLRQVASTWCAKINHGKIAFGFLQKFPRSPHEHKLDVMPGPSELMSQIKLHPLGSATAEVGEEERDKHTSIPSLDHV